MVDQGKYKSKITNHYGTQILTLKTIKKKLKIFAENLVHPFDDQTSQVDRPPK